jgi:hypothetical protein
LETGRSETPAQKLLVQSWTGPEHFIKIGLFHQKLLNFSSMTDAQTDTCPPISKWMGKFFNALFCTFHFTAFALLIPFMKNGTDSTVFAFSLIIEDTTEKVLQLVIPLKSIYNQILGFIVQKMYF